MGKYITTTPIIIGNDRIPTPRNRVVNLSPKQAEVYLRNGWVKPYVERKEEKTAYQTKEEKTVTRTKGGRKRRNSATAQPPYETVWQGNLSNIHEYNPKE